MVVEEAPDATFAAGSATVASAAPGVTATGRASFATGVAKLTVAPAQARTPFGITEPIAVVDLLRGVVQVRPYGGSEVQGVGTKRYEIDIDVSHAIERTPLQRRAPLVRVAPRVGSDGRVWAVVFVDSDGRIRRTLVPVKLESERPAGHSKRIPEFVSVDFYEFGESP